MPAKLVGRRSLRIYLEIADGRGKRNRYTLRPLAPAVGMGWRLLKLAMKTPEVLDRYAVYCTEQDGFSCSCPGFEGHGYCKHVDSLKVLLGFPLIDEVAKRAEEVKC